MKFWRVGTLLYTLKSPSTFPSTSIREQLNTSLISTTSDCWKFPIDLIPTCPFLNGMVPMPQMRSTVDSDNVFLPAEETPELLARRAAMNREILETVQEKLAENPSWNFSGEIHRVVIDAMRKHFLHPTAKLLQERRKPPPRKPQDFITPLLRSPEKAVILSPLSDAAKALIFGEDSVVRRWR